MRNFVATSALFAYANAFWGTGHLLVARQAQALLQQNDPYALTAALQVLAPLKQDYPTLTTDESTNPFTECALFADNIKSMGYSW
jgi:hypothetical protein